MLGLKVANAAGFCRGSFQMLKVQSNTFEQLLLCLNISFQIK